MAQQEEPLYDFPEPTQPTPQKFAGHQRGQGSLRSVSVLDRLLLTIPVWVQLSINAATALHILQREPPGTFLVRRSRTSQRNVLCVRLTDDSVPSFVQQFGIREDQSTVCLEISAISFPDLPRLIAFYCVSRDVLPFPLELPEAISKATSHKELESISHMGVEFWSSHLNVRGPRETPKPQKDHGKPGNMSSTLSNTAPQISFAAQPDPAPQLDAETENNQSDTATLFQEFCPITTRSPGELDCGSGLGALCFINPLFLQSQTSSPRRRMFKRSLKVRVSTETSTLLLPPLAPPPPPPLMPKTRGRCKVKAQAQGQASLSQSQLSASPKQPSANESTAQDTQCQTLTHTKDDNMEFQVQPQKQEEGQIREKTETEAAADQLQIPTSITEMDHLPDHMDYMQPSSRVNVSHSPTLSPYLPPKMPPFLFPKVSPSLLRHDSSGASPSLSPYQSPSPSPNMPFSLSPFTSPSFSQLHMEEYHTPAALLTQDQERNKQEAQEERVGEDDEDEDETEEEQCEGWAEEDMGLIIQQMCTASLNDRGSCSSLSSLEELAETPPPSPLVQDNDTIQ